MLYHIQRVDIFRSMSWYLHHATVGHAQFAHQSGPAASLLSAQGQGFGHLPPRGKGGGGGGVTPAGGWVCERRDEVS